MHAVVFGGDVLFAGSIGRTDFPDGSFEQLASGIRDKAVRVARRYRGPTRPRPRTTTWAKRNKRTPTSEGGGKDDR